MKRTLVLAAVSLVAFGACSANASPQADAETYIRKGEAAWVRAEVTGDRSVARRVLANDYGGVFPDGSVANKTVAVSFFKPQNAMTSGRLDYVHVRVFWLLLRGEWRIVNSEDQFQPLKQPVGH